MKAVRERFQRMCEIKIPSLIRVNCRNGFLSIARDFRNLTSHSTSSIWSSASESRRRIFPSQGCSAAFGRMRALCALLLVAVVKIYAPPKSIILIRTFHVLASHALNSPSVQKTRISSCVRKDKRKKKTVSTTNTTVAPRRSSSYTKLQPPVRQRKRQNKARAQPSQCRFPDPGQCMQKVLLACLLGCPI